MAVRVAAALAAVALAFGLPVLIFLRSVVGERWRPLVGTLMVVSVAVSVAAWFLWRPRRVPGPGPGEPADPPG